MSPRGRQTCGDRTLFLDDERTRVNYVSVMTIPWLVGLSGNVAFHIKYTGKLGLNGMFTRTFTPPLNDVGNLDHIVTSQDLHLEESVSQT